MKIERTRVAISVWAALAAAAAVALGLTILAFSIQFVLMSTAGGVCDPPSQRLGSPRDPSQLRPRTVVGVCIWVGAWSLPWTRPAWAVIPGKCQQDLVVVLGTPTPLVGEYRHPERFGMHVLVRWEPVLRPTQRRVRLQPFL